MKIIDGRKIAGEIERNARKRAEGKEIKISTIVTKMINESILFARLKEKAFKRAGFDFETIYMEDASMEVLYEIIGEMNNDESVTGINIQLPVAEQIDYAMAVERIAPEKDIEGMNPVNLGKIIHGEEKLVPCTAKAIIKIIEHEGIELKGKNAVIVNHSSIIGKPLSIMLLNRNATVSVCHVYTKKLEEITKKADILVTATGVRGLIKEKHVKKGAVILDAGIKEEGGKVYGDVDETALKIASAATPVPGGVGPVTIASMIENAVIAHEIQSKSS
ncbi:MAG: bifunctional 5,10-methylenetetrahydrofolate dehydrogenase/5,10-methenyltetrahydrofolate cyclohydrolase [Thermoplasmata archaeon]|nr:bifunctional 5,10-methylenetetrahydrofolate dehydrogenase/5,10-methenyltetrahydrofolate cyclohydrolase [Thermoplasmata archaeon]